jgi:glycosyltransferase involved in cell wall biosynthesis
MCRFSIITVVKNNEKQVSDCIHSVHAQSYKNFEYIVIDGLSSDSTVQVIESFGNTIDILVSEPDNGIYHAMNKGIRLASGDYLFFLNADDRFADHRVLEDVGAALETHGKVDLIFGNQIYQFGDRLQVRKQHFPVSRKQLARRTILHQTLFARRSLFEKTNGFSLDYKIVSDYHWILQVVLTHHCTYVYLDRNISIMRTNGLSWTTNFERERMKAMKPFFSYAEIIWWRLFPQTIIKIKKGLSN